MARSLLPRLAVGAAAGAATGLALVTAEAGSSLLAHSALPARAWAFLAAYCVPALAIGGTLLALALTAERATSALVWMSCAAYCTAVASQDLIGGRSRVAPLRIAALLVSAVAAAAAAWAAERVVERRGPGRVPGLVLRMALLLPIVALVQLGGRALHGAPKEAALALPVAVAAGGVMAAVLLAPLAARTAALPAAGGAAALAAVIALASAAQAAGPGRGALRDQTQPAPPPAAAPLPNVVLIVLDTVRASSLSSYGYQRRTTPHLDAFAAGAVRFSTATTVSSWSVPAHASLFTGLFAPEHGAGLSLRDASRRLERPAPLDARLETLAERLGERGYATAGISANLLLAPHMNLTQGFRYLDVRASPLALKPGYRTLLLRAEGLLPAALLADPVLATFPTTFRSAEEITDAAQGWLARRPSGQPYLLFLNYMDAHTPFVRRPGFSGRWPGRSPRLPAFGLPDAEAVMSGRRQITAEETAHIRALYDDALGYLDHHLHRLLRTLDAQPDRDRTWIIVTADHGEMLGEHQRLGHDCVFFQEVLHVPLIMRYPASAPEAARHGSVDHRPVQITDLAPAIVAAAGGPAPREAPSHRGVMVATVDCFCWQSHVRFHGPAGQSLAMGGLKYVEEERRAPVLFDLAADPQETRNLAAARPDDARRLGLELERWRAGLAAPPSPAPAARDAAREEALRALGYVK
jgi:arylsulfatase A-like enzyme